MMYFYWIMGADSLVNGYWEFGNSSDLRYLYMFLQHT